MQKVNNDYDVSQIFFIRKAHLSLCHSLANHLRSRKLLSQMLNAEMLNQNKHIYD